MPMFRSGVEIGEVFRNGQVIGEAYNAGNLVYNSVLRISEIVLPSSETTTNLRAHYDSLGHPPPVDNMEISFRVPAGVVLGGHPALQTGTWAPFADPIPLVVDGKVQGRGGNGADWGAGGTPGADGGDALDLQHPLHITISGSARVAGGGGGGCAYYYVGGGGAGSPPGTSECYAGDPQGPYEWEGSGVTLQTLVATVDKGHFPTVYNEGYSAFGGDPGEDGEVQTQYNPPPAALAGKGATRNGFALTGDTGKIIGDIV